MNWSGLERLVPVQQLMAGHPNWWNLTNMQHPTAQHPSSPFSHPPSSSSTASYSSFSSSILPHYPPSSTFSLPACHENQDLPESWSQLLMEGLAGDENKYSYSELESYRKMDSCEDPMLLPSSSGHVVDVKQESSESGHMYEHGNEFQAIRSPWGHVLPTSPKSCLTCYSSNTLDFSHSKVEGKTPEPAHSSECNSTATVATFKKAKVQPSSTQSTFKVRKEKLGDRITALHQLVSPFGKTDTASVLLEAIGYIRFLQSQIEALSSPYLASVPSSSLRQPGQGERNSIFPEDPGRLLNGSFSKKRGAPEQDASVDGPQRDLKSRGLCLVPISCTFQLGSDNGADYWGTNLGGEFP